MSYWNRQTVGELRGAVYRAEGSIIAILKDRLSVEVLQLAGDGLLDAVHQRASGAVELAKLCAAGLRERDWEGDRELVVQLEAATEQGALPMLRSLPVDLEELASILEGDGGRVNLRTGECWPFIPDIDLDDVDDDADDDDWL